jgi:hypothetical protein
MQKGVLLQLAFAYFFSMKDDRVSILLFPNTDMITSEFAVFQYPILRGTLIHGAKLCSLVH